MPGKGEGGGGIVEGCVDHNCEKGCQKGGEGERDEGERSKSKAVISGVWNGIGSGEGVLSEEVGYKVQAGEEEEGGKCNAIEYAECDEETKEGGRQKG